MRNTMLILLSLVCVNTYAQNVSAKSNRITIDLSDPRKDNSVSIPTISWTEPVDSISYLKDGKFSMMAEVKSIYGLNSVKLRLIDRRSKVVLKEFKLSIEENSRNSLRIDRSFTLPNGEIEVEVYGTVACADELIADRTSRQLELSLKRTKWFAFV